MTGVLAWLLAIELLGLLALPLVLPIFRAFPDRGWGLAKPIGWALLAYPLWLGASVGLMPFSLGTLLAILALSASGAAVVAHRRRRTLRAILRGAGPAIALSEGIFLLAGAFFLFLRVQNPDLWHTYWGGEKPMETAHLNAILRSAQFPPHDPWFAGGVLNYYYYGQYLVATLVKLTGIPTEIAFNLAMPTISALVAGAAFSVAAMLARLALRQRPAGLTLGFGALGTFLIVGAGNYAGLGEVISSVRTGDRSLLGFGYFWDSSRAITGAITEFPYFTQVWADLHAHAIALPFTILVLGLVIALATPPRPHTLTPHAPTLALLALILGGLACINAWDVPTYLLVTGVGIFLATGRQCDGPGLREVARRLALAGAGTVAVGLGAYLLYLPFFRHFRAQFSSPARTRIPTPLDQYLDHFGLFIAVVVATLVASFLLLARGRRAFAFTAIFLALAGADFGLRATALTGWLATRTPFFANEIPANGVPVSANGTAAALLGLLAVLLAALWILARDEPGLRWPLPLLLAAVGVTLGPEIVFLGDDLLGTDLERLNTVFKFSFQGWTLFALGSVGALAWLYDTAPRWSAAPFAWLRGAARERLALATRVAAAGALALLLLGALVYPVAATPFRLAERFPPPAHLGPTLHGHRWMEYGLMPRCEACAATDGGMIAFRDDLAAIRWLNETVAGTPVIAEASVGAWRGNGSRFANATGLPTILGWDHHQAQQRPVADVAPRVAEVRALYHGRDEAEKLAILRRYRVEYLIVGAIERGWHLSPAPGDAWASPEGLAVLEGLAGRYLEPVFRSGDTVIYRVLPGATQARR